MLSIIAGILIGGLITFFTAIGAEYLRRPQLRLVVEHDLPDFGGGGQRRHLRLKLRNEELSPAARWLQRAPAQDCRGVITFRNLDGQDVFGRVMAVRWARSPEPIASQTASAGDTGQGHILDWVRTTTDYRIDVYPGEEEILDVAVKFNDESDCYGWNNQAYFNNWRTPEWRLGRGLYLVDVVITSSAQKCRDVFRLVNDPVQHGVFRLLPANEEDRSRVQ